MRVAIVDDVQEDAQLLQDHLRSYQEENGSGWETALYSNGRDFLALYQPVFDLVILDIDMPRLNEVDAARCSSFLVNLRHVKGIDKQDVLVEEEQIKISREKRLEFMEKFYKYLGGIR